MSAIKTMEQEMAKNSVKSFLEDVYQDACRVDVRPIVVNFLDEVYMEASKRLQAEQLSLNLAKTLPAFDRLLLSNIKPSK